MAAFSPVALVGLIIAGYVFFLAPFYWLWKEMFVATAPTGWGTIIIFQVAMVIVLRWLVDNHFKEPVVSTFLHPVGFSFLFLTVLCAGSRRVVGSGVQWKKRLYDWKSYVE